MVETDPATLLGFGTWTAFGAGRVPVGLDSGDVDFDTLEETGGAKTHTLVTSEIPSHTHGSSGSHSHTITGGDSGTGTTTEPLFTTTGNSTRSGSTTGTGAHEHTSVGSDGAHNNVQPYIVVYM